MTQACPQCGAELDVTELDLLSRIACPACGEQMLVGSTVDHYELESVLGRGGMGEVYRARDAGLDRHVALKVLRKDHSGNASFISQLETEAAITASINHPHVVKVFTTGTDHGRFFIAMELVDKGTLDDLIRIQGRVAEIQALEVAIQIAEGLRAAHQHGMIHRDVKPGNILFADAHTAKIVDFGLAALESEATTDGEIWGTPYYIAPEKLDRKPEDCRSDIYSLGATIFHALAGRPPFEAADATMVALKHLKSQAVSLQAFAPWVSGSTAYVINRTLNKDPEKRYQSYDELIEHLEYARSELVEKGGQPQTKKRVVLETEEDRKLWSYVTFGMVAVMLLIGGGFLLFRGSGKKGAAKTAATSAASAGAAGADAKHTQQYESARQLLLTGKSAEAAAAFHALAADASTPEPLLHWATVHEGLAWLLQDNGEESRKAFASLAARPFSASDDAGRQLAEFFQTLAKIGGADKAVPAAAGQDFDRNSYRAIGFLIAGLKDWNLSEIDEAGPLLRQFQSCIATGDSAWILEYRGLIGEYLADYTDYRGAAEFLKAARNNTERKKASDALKKATQGMKHGAKLVLRTDVLEREAEKHMQNEAALAEEARKGAAEGWRSWGFLKAREALQKYEPAQDGLRRERAMLLLKADWLLRFRRFLVLEAAASGAKTALVKKSGAALPGDIQKADESGVEVKGGAKATWNDLSPDSILTLATTCLRDGAPAERVERTWLTGVYAAMIGKSAEARKLLTEAAEAQPDYAAYFPLLLPTSPAKNVAREAKATASKFATPAGKDESPAKALDGDPRTKWCSSDGNPSWLQLDFSAPKTISRWVVKHAHAGGEAAEMNTVDFALQKSDDAQSWQDVDKVAGNTSDETSRSVPAFSARYVRLFVTKPTRNNNPGTRIPEFELYSPATVIDGPLPDFAAAPALSAPSLTSIDIGLRREDAPGNTVVSDETGVIEISASGKDIWEENDSFRFAYRPWTGDGSVTAYVTTVGDVDPWSKVGLMMRETLAPDSKNVVVLATHANSVGTQRRIATKTKTESRREGSFSAPVWLKVERKGDVFTMSASNDGVGWKTIETVTLPMPPTIYAGIAASAHSSGRLGTATVESVQFLNTGAAAPVKRGALQPLDIRSAFTADSRRGLFRSPERLEEGLRFPQFGQIEANGIPFTIANPAATSSGNNLCILKGGEAIAKDRPQQVEINVPRIPARALHILGGVGGWGWQREGDPLVPVAKITVAFANGASESHELRNGVEVADYFRLVDVPGSQMAPGVVADGHQVRTLEVPLKNAGQPIEKLVLESLDSRIAPVFVAITAELPESARK